MRARAVSAIAMLFLIFGARPALADGPIIFQRDGTYFHSIHAELQGGASAESSDSTEAPKLAVIAGGASLAGLAAYFIASNGGGDGFPNTPGFPHSDPGGVIIPPQEQSPALPNQPFNPGGSGGGGGTGTDDAFDGPVTTTPEPVSMTLLATGLAGIGAARFKRRRG